MSFCRTWSSSDCPAALGILLEPLIAMQPVPEHGEKKCRNESGYERKNDESGGGGRAKRLDHECRLNKVHPEQEVDQGLRPAKRNQQRPEKMAAAEQRAKGHACLERIYHHQIPPIR